MMERGEIRWYKFRPPDKQRPVVVLTRNSALKFLGEVIIAPVTSTIRDLPTEVLLDERDGMKTACVVNLDHVQTISKNKLGALINKLSDEKRDKIKAALLFALGYDD